MAAMMGGTMRAPFAAVIFALELTHDINSLPLLLAACIVADAVTVLYMRRSILTEKVARRGYHIAYEYSVDPIQARLVGEVMDDHPATIPETMLVSELADRIARGDQQLARRQGIPILNEHGNLAGIITRGDILSALQQSPDGQLTVLAAGQCDVIAAYPDEPLHVAVAKMLGNQVGRLPVVSRTEPRRLVGYLGRTGIMEARQRALEEEQLRERTWQPLRRRGVVETGEPTPPPG
jgi:CBS domain-containing protein